MGPGTPNWEIHGRKVGTTRTSDGLRQTMEHYAERPQALVKQKACHMYALVTWSKKHCRHMRQIFQNLFHLAHKDSKGGVLGMVT